jgi:UDP-MurNAc hydroxylase
LNPEIEFVNHACFIVRHNQVSLITDPWIDGFAFNLGWKLLVDSPEKYLDPNQMDFTHIYFTHEHPDHFSPEYLVKINPEKRRNTTVLFQKTPDRRVVAFCEKLGFQVVELKSNQVFSISEDFSIEINSIPYIDSYSIIRAGDAVIVNLNDCGTNKSDLLKIHKKYRNIDVLFTQYSYASWVGNPSDTYLRAIAAQESLDNVKRQIKLLQPRFVVPFASFVYFSHVENAYMNGERNHIGVASKLIESSGAVPIVLTPGSKWNFEKQDELNAIAIDYYEELHDVTNKKLTESGSSVEIEELRALIRDLSVKLTKANSKIGLRLIRLPPLKIGAPLTVHLWDLDVTVTLDTFIGTLISSKSKPDVSMHSESLKFAIQFDYGIDTLAVNGRFRVIGEGGRNKLVKAFATSLLNNGGRYVRFNILRDRTFINRIISRLLAS